MVGLKGGRSAFTEYKAFALPPRQYERLDHFVDHFRTMEEEMETMQRRMDEAMERISVEEPGQSYRREYRNENAHSRTYFSESVTVMRPVTQTGSRYKDARGLGVVPLVAAVGAVWLWFRKTRQFLSLYDSTHYKEQHRWRMAAMWPVLLFTSSKFREEWERARIAQVDSRTPKGASEDAQRARGDSL